MLDIEADLDPQRWNESYALAHQLPEDMAFQENSTYGYLALRSISYYTTEKLREPVPRKGVNS